MLRHCSRTVRGISSANEQLGLLLEATIYASVADEEERADTIFHHCACQIKASIVGNSPADTCREMTSSILAALSAYLSKDSR